MDPGSATVAFVGFAASIATLLAAAIESSRTIHDAYKSIKHAPREIQRLAQKSERLHKMISEVQNISQDFNDGLPPPFIRDFWLQNASPMYNDFLDFKARADKLQSGMAEKSATGKHMLLRVHSFFSEREMRKCEEQLSDHIQTIGILMNMLSQ